MIALNNRNEKRFEIAKYLIEAGADLNIQVYNWTALDYLFTINSNDYNAQVEEDEFNFALYMIERGADINVSAFGNVIISAARMNNKMMVEYLINQKNIDMNYVDPDYGNTSLMWAVYFNCFDTVKYLLENNANLEIVNKEGKSVFDIAADKNNSQILALLNK